MSHNTRNNHRNKLPQTARGTNNTLHQQSQINQPSSTQNITPEISSENQVQPSPVNEEHISLEQSQQNQEILAEQNPIIEENESNEPNVEKKKEDFKIRQVNVINQNRGIGHPIMSSRENHSNISIPSLNKKTNNHTNMSRNGQKNFKFDKNLEKDKII